MGHQIMKQGDGYLCVFSTGTDSIILWDATPEDLLDYYAERAARDARTSAQRTIDAVLADKPEEAYYQFTMTFDEAMRQHLEGGHEPVAFQRADASGAPNDEL